MEEAFVNVKIFSALIKVLNGRVRGSPSPCSCCTNSDQSGYLKDLSARFRLFSADFLNIALAGFPYFGTT